MTFFGQLEHEEQMRRTFREVQKRAGLKPLPQYVSMGLPPANDKKNKKGAK